MAIRFHTCERKSRYIFTVAEKNLFSNLPKKIRVLDRINRIYRILPVGSSGKLQFPVYYLLIHHNVSNQCFKPVDKG